MQAEKLFHVSEDPDIKIFSPRPATSYLDKINRNVVFAISGKLLHNYLFPRQCPRVTFYAGIETTVADKDKFFGHTSADFVIGVEKKWFDVIRQKTLYCYEFPPDSFLLLDECANYYISYKEIKPISVKQIDNIFNELFKRNIELRFLPNLWGLADEVKKSTLKFSLIRMQNAEPKQEESWKNNV